jgi:hypothetical protein
MERNRRESMCEHEFDEIEWPMDCRLARRAWRDDGQVINGLNNLSQILETEVTEADLQRGRVEFHVIFNRGEAFRPEDVFRVPAIFRFPARGKKQPLGDFLRRYYEIMQQVRHEDVEGYDMRLATRLFFLRAYKYSTLSLKEALSFYLNAQRVGPGYQGYGDRPISFQADPYAEFMIWTEYLKKVKYRPRFRILSKLFSAWSKWGGYVLRWRTTSIFRNKSSFLDALSSRSLISLSVTSCEFFVPVLETGSTIATSTT